MTAEEVGKLLGFAALYDNRKVDVPDVVAWHRVLGDLPYTDAEDAVAAHYTDSTERLMPAHVRQRVKAIRGKRLDDAEPHLEPPSGLDGPAYQRWLIDSRKRIADGHDKPRTLEAR